MRHRATPPPHVSVGGSGVAGYGKNVTVDVTYMYTFTGTYLLMEIHFFCNILIIIQQYKHVFLTQEIP